MYVCIDMQILLILLTSTFVRRWVSLKETFQVPLTHTIYNENIHHSMATNGGGTLCRRYAAAVVHLIVNQKNQLNNNINNTMPKKCPLEMWNMLFVSRQQCSNDKMFGFIISKPSCRPGKHMGKDVLYVHAHDAPLQVWRV